MSQQNQYPYGGSQQQQQQQGGSQQQQSGQPQMTPEQYAAYQAYLARGASGVPGYPQTPAAGGWPAGYAQNAQAYPAAQQGQSAYPATGGHHVASYAQQRLAGQHVLRPGTPVRPGTPGLSAHVQPPGSRHIYAAYPPPAPPATPAPMPTDDKPFPCDYCSRTFARQHDLRRHVETHSGDKPYACSFPGCTHAYTRKDALKRHQDASNHHV